MKRDGITLLMPRVLADRALQVLEIPLASSSDVSVT